MCVTIPFQFKYCGAAELSRTSYSTDLDPAKITLIILMFFSENDNDVKNIISSYIANHIAITTSIQIIAIRFIFKVMQPDS